jgi:CubicO group peptidase (beta-lactamase class C family)
MSDKSTLDKTITLRLEPFTKDTMRDQQVPGFSISIVKDGEPAYIQGFGVAGVESQKPVTTESIFLMASMSKAFTATAIMQLVEVGKIDLDAPVTDYLPYFQLADDRYKDIVIRHLLIHTSGLPSLDFETTLLGYWSAIMPEFDEGAAERYVRGLSETILSCAPGKEFNYSDMAYNVLGEVIAKVSGQLFEDYVQDHILTPVGMRKSTFLLREVDQNLLASPHHLDDRGNVVESEIFPYSRPYAPCGGLFSNVEDMTRWALINLNRGALNGTRILAESSYEVLWAAQVDTGWIEFGSPKSSSYGCGWSINEIEGHPIFSHGGGELGYQSFILLAPEDAIAVVTMGNRRDTFTEPFYAKDIASVVTKLLLGIEM